MPDFVIEYAETLPGKAEGNSGLTQFSFRVGGVGLEAGVLYTVQFRIVEPSQLDAYDLEWPFKQFQGGGQSNRKPGNDAFDNGYLFLTKDSPTKTFQVNVQGDRLVEANELFRIELYSYSERPNQSIALPGPDLPIKAEPATSAVAVILNDDLPRLHAADPSQQALATQRGETALFQSTYGTTPTVAAVQAKAKAAAQQEIKAALEDGRFTAEEKIAIEQGYKGYNFDDDLKKWVQEAVKKGAAKDVGKSIRDSILDQDERKFLLDYYQSLSFSEMPSFLDQAVAALPHAGSGPGDLWFVPVSADPFTMEITGDAGVDTAIINLSSEYLSGTEKQGATFIVTLKDGNQIVMNEIEYLAFSDRRVELDPDNNLPPLEAGDIKLVAAIYQFFVGSIPNPGGFEFLISSPDSPTDLNDPFYAQFNTENQFINFANNLGSFGAGKATFAQNYGSLTFDEAVRKAFEAIIGSDAVLEQGGDPEASIAFFLGARAYFEAVANDRVVPSGVSLDQAIKVVAVGSILNEAVKAGYGAYAAELNIFVNAIEATGVSNEFGKSLFMAPDPYMPYG